jgi:hypothetical protein
MGLQRMIGDEIIGNSRNRIAKSLILLFLIIVHLGIVSSIIWQERPLIWPLHNDTIHRKGRSADFYSIYHAGVNLSHGMDPYLMNPDGVTPYFYPFRYLPIVAYAGRAFSFFSPQYACKVWVILLEGFLAVLLVVLWKTLADERIRLFVIGLLLINSPYFLELYMGQFTFAAVTLCCLGLVLPVGQFLYGGSAVLKPFTLAAVPAMAKHRQYWKHSAFAVLGVLPISIFYFLYHPDQWTTFYAANFHPHDQLHAGNYGFVRLLYLIAVDGRMPISLRTWEGYIEKFRLIMIAGVALLVIHSKNKSILMGVSALLLAHFLSYQHTWEHHMSGVCVIAAMLLTVPDQPVLFSRSILVSLVLLALPTPFGLFDVAKNPSVFDPSVYWPRAESYLLVLSKVIPTMILFLSCVVSLCLGGLMSTRKAMRCAIAKTAKKDPKPLAIPPGED